MAEQVQTQVQTKIASGTVLTEDQRAKIAQAGGDVVWEGSAGAPHGGDSPSLQDLDGLVDVLGDVEVWLGPGVSAEVLERAPRLRWIQATAAGIERFISPELTASPVVLTNVRGMHASTTADHALALMLALSRGLRGAIDAQTGGTWASIPVTDVIPLDGSRVLVLGTGHIGSAIAHRVAAFGAEVVGVNRSGRPAPAFSAVVEVSQLAEAARDADWLVVAAPATDDTVGLVSAEVIAALPSSAVIVNIARGAVLDERATIDALRSGRLRAAGLDVFEREPLPPDSPLWTLPNVVLTAHSGGAMHGYNDRAVDYFLRNLARFQQGDELTSLVDKAAGY